MRIRYMLWAGVSSLLMLSCGKTPEEEIPEVKPEITVPSESQSVFTSGLSFEAGPQVQTSKVSFTTTASWTADVADTKASAWLSIQPTSGGAGPVNITISAQPNTEMTARDARITITCGDVIKSINVHQVERKGIFASTKSFILSSEAGLFDVDLQSNVQYTVEISVNWIKCIETKDLRQETLTFQVDANEAYDDRTGIISITPRDEANSEAGQTIRVQQLQKDALFLGKSAFTVLGDGGTLYVELESNFDPTVLPQADWIHYTGYTETKGLVKGLICLTIDENSQEDIREGTVIVRGNNEALPESTIAVCQFMQRPTFQISAANIQVNDDRLTSRPEYGEYYNDTGKDNLLETGVYKVWAYIREMTKSGTRTMSAEDVKSMLKTHRIIIFNEGMFFEDYEDKKWFEFPPVITKGWYYKYEDPKYRHEGHGHGESMQKNMLAVLFPVLDALDDRIIFFPMDSRSDTAVGCRVMDIEYFTYIADNGYRRIHEDLVEDYYTDSYVEMLKLFKGFPNLTFYSACAAFSDEGTTYDYIVGQPYFTTLHALFSQPNAICMGAFGNIYSNHPEWLFPLKEEDWEDPYEAYRHSGRTNWWSFGAEGVMGGDNNGITHSWNGVDDYKNLYDSKVPHEKYRNDDKIWCETSQVLGWNEATSPATQVAAAKYYLSSLLNHCINPDITFAENRQIIREACLDQAVYLGEQYYMTGKRINPGGVAKRLFSSELSLASLSGESLIPLTTSIFKGSVFLGHGVVDESGNRITEENYKTYFGKTLYLSPSLLRKYGYMPGESVELTEYLCIGADGAGTGNQEDAFLYIDKHVYSVPLTE